MAPYPFLCLSATTGTICFYYHHETMTRTKHLIFLKRRELCRQDYLITSILGPWSQSLSGLSRGDRALYKSFGITCTRIYFLQQQCISQLP
ncbi:hypothetical protein BDV09DRAFT_89769 [Aspergillus tetrazonus]